MIDDCAIYSVIDIYCYCKTCRKYLKHRMKNLAYTFFTM